MTITRQRPVGEPSIASGDVEVHADAAQVVREHLAERVVGDAPDVRGLAAERRDPGRGVRGRAARRLRRRAHLRVDLVGAGGVDHRHRAALDAGAGDEVVGLVRQHVDQRVAQREHVEPLHFIAALRASTTG